MFLDEIVEIKRQEVKEKKSVINIRDLEQIISTQSEPRDFMACFNDSSISLIAEIKYASPSLGIINDKIDHRLMASIYEKGGARGISVLTEGYYFKGALSFIRDVKAHSSLPVLQKDFIIDPFQIYEGRAYGADAILLIACLLDREELKDFIDLAVSLKLTPLVEIHSEEELNKISSFDLPLIGINNRDLRTFEVDIKTTLCLIKMIPSKTKVISESGIKTKEHVRLLKKAGVSGILVGETLMRSNDPLSTLRGLTIYDMD